MYSIHPLIEDQGRDIPLQHKKRDLDGSMYSKSLGIVVFQIFRQEKSTDIQRSRP